jgi:colanic acid biosynthesis glycosyl transferase WcaI
MLPLGEGAAAGRAAQRSSECLRKDDWADIGSDPFHRRMVAKPASLRCPAVSGPREYGSGRRLQLWSIYFHPELTGIAPATTLLARQLAARGWQIEVVAAHPHYPEPVWGRRLLPSREMIDGIRVTRVPLLPGRDTRTARLRQELSFTASLAAAAPFLGRPLMRPPDLMLVGSPSFPALAPAIVNARARQIPMVLWLHDLLPEGAAATGILDEDSATVRASRRLERAAYRTAERIVVLSRSFEENLLAKGVPAEKVDLIYYPATLPIPDERPARALGDPPTVICMGNIGLSQGLAELVRAFEASEEMERRGVRLVIRGAGVAADEVRAEIRSERTQMPGLLGHEALAHELQRFDLALVTQSYEGTEFNLPSKLMNYMGHGLPVIAAVNPSSEAARLVCEAGAGWVVDSSHPELLPRAIADALDRPDEMNARGLAGHRYAVEHFSPDFFGSRFDRVLSEVAELSPRD